MSDDGKGITWKATLIGGAMTLATSTAGYVSSHWGGVTSEQAAKDKTELIAKIDSATKAAVAKVADDMREYVDQKFSKAPVFQPPKRKVRREQ